MLINANRIGLGVQGMLLGHDLHRTVPQRRLLHWLLPQDRRGVPRRGEFQFSFSHDNTYLDQDFCCSSTNIKSIKYWQNNAGSFKVSTSGCGCYGRPKNNANAYCAVGANGNLGACVNNLGSFHCEF